MVWELRGREIKTIKYKNMANTPFKMKGPSLYSPLNKKNWIRKMFSKKKKQNNKGMSTFDFDETSETSTESLNRQVKEKDAYYSKQKGTSLKR